MSGSAEQPQLLYPASPGALPLVYTAYDKWSGIAMSAFGIAEQYAAEVANVPVTTVNYNATFDPQIALPGFPSIAAPVAPNDLKLVVPPSPGAPPSISVPVLPPPQYLSNLLTTLQGLLQQFMTGNPLPAGLARQLRDRAYTETFAEENRAVAGAYDEFAARGFFEPGGVLNNRVSAARVDARMKRQQASRDIFIQEQMTAVENLRLAFTNGIQLEGMNVQVFKAEADVLVETERAAIEAENLSLSAWRARVELFNTQLQAATTQVDVELREFQAQVQLFQAQAQMASAAGEYDNRRFQLNLAQEQAIVDTEMKRADQQFAQLQFVTNIMLEIKKTLATVAAQLASAAMSAVNIGASARSDTNESIGYDLHVNYSGSMADSN
jgi:hypothetical protein